MGVRQARTAVQDCCVQLAADMHQMLSVCQPQHRSCAPCQFPQEVLSRHAAEGIAVCHQHVALVCQHTAPLQHLHGPDTQGRTSTHENTQTHLAVSAAAVCAWQQPRPCTRSAVLHAPSGCVLAAHLSRRRARTQLVEVCPWQAGTKTNAPRHPVRPQQDYICAAFSRSRVSTHSSSCHAAPAAKS